MKESMSESISVILYDSLCPQCSWFMKHLEGVSTHKVLSLESEQAKGFYKNGKISVDPEFSDTMIVIYKDQELLYWNALVFCIGRSDFPKWVKKMVAIVPEKMGNQLYKVLQFFRKLLRKKQNQCKLK